MGCGLSKFEQKAITTTYESNDKPVNVARDQDHVDHHGPISSTLKLEDCGNVNIEDNIDDYRARDGHIKYSSSNTKEEAKSMQEREVKGCGSSNDFDKHNGIINNNRREVEEDRQKDEEEEDFEEDYEEDDEEDDQQLEELVDVDREDSLCFPGSPSFRDYCNLDDEYHSKDNCKKGE